VVTTFEAIRFIVGDVIAVDSRGRVGHGFGGQDGGGVASLQVKHVIYYVLFTKNSISHGYMLYTKLVNVKCNIHREVE
jgi:hypothetical protein